MDKNYKVSDIAFKLGSMAVQAILREAACFPSPGLVSPISDGSHQDMDYFLFLDSTSSLIKPMILCAEVGLSSSTTKQVFTAIREVGKSGEKDMFEATKGVNTHKGMLFLMGVACAAAGKAVYEGRSFKDIQNIIKEMTEGITVSELTNMPNSKERTLSHGEKLFLKYGITGVRGEVEQGLPIVFDKALPIYEECEDMHINDRLVHTLIGIMQYCEDTTIVHRHSLEVLKEIQAKSKFIFGLGGLKADFGINAVYSFDSELKRRNISPGGSADMLALTVFLSNVKNSFFI